jgi:hypothetical protein
LSRQPTAVRFQAEHSNDCWQFDMSPSDLKQLKKPSWVREDGSPPTLMLFSAVDDRSGVAYQVVGVNYSCATDVMRRAIREVVSWYKKRE